nr:hypothetical protein [Lysobacter enzymogenes]
MRHRHAAGIAKTEGSGRSARPGHARRAVAAGESLAHRGVALAARARASPAAARSPGDGGEPGAAPMADASNAGTATSDGRRRSRRGEGKWRHGRVQARLPARPRRRPCRAKLLDRSDQDRRRPRLLEAVHARIQQVVERIGPTHRGGDLRRQHLRLAAASRTARPPG